MYNKCYILFRKVFLLNSIFTSTTKPSFSISKWCVTSLEISESHQISIFYYDELLFIKYHFQWHSINWTCYRHSFDVLIKWYTIRNIKKNHQHDKTIWKRCANAILCTMRVIKYLHWHFAEPQNKCRWQWYSVCVCVLSDSVQMLATSIELRIRCQSMFESIM